MNASLTRLTTVVGADVVVVTVLQTTRHADSAGAEVAVRTYLTIVTDRGVRNEYAPELTVTAVVRAGVSIGAAQGRSTEAGPSSAGVSGTTRVAVVTGGGVSDVRATLGRVAEVVRANVGIVAVKSRTTNTDPGTAEVAAGTSVGVRTGCRVGDVVASPARQTGIVATGVEIIAVSVVPLAATLTDTHAVNADVGIVEGVAIVAGIGIWPERAT